LGPCASCNDSQRGREVERSIRCSTPLRDGSSMPCGPWIHKSCASGLPSSQSKAAISDGALSMPPIISASRTRAASAFFSCAVSASVVSSDIGSSLASHSRIRVSAPIRCTSSAMACLCSASAAEPSSTIARCSGPPWARSTQRCVTTSDSASHGVSGGHAPGSVAGAVRVADRSSTPASTFRPASSSASLSSPRSAKPLPELALVKAEVVARNAALDSTHT
jgi:hypothetical protein